MRAAWRMVVRRYQVWCAREDVVRNGLETPAGVWVCDRCGAVILSPLMVRGHLTACLAGSRPIKPPAG